MKAARIRLLLAGCLFAAWIGWLVYLATTTTTPIILSRPQFLEADMDVLAEVKGDDVSPASSVQVAKVLWVRKGSAAPEQKVIDVDDLNLLTDANGWRGPGRYILPLVVRKGRFELASIGGSPGYPPPPDYKGQRGEKGAQRIYPATPETLHQEEDIRHGNWE